MRLVWLAVLTALALPASAQGIGGSAERTTTSTQTTTTKTQDGDTTTTTTTTRSETTSSGGGWSLGGLFGSSPAAGPSYESLGGKWKIGESNGTKACELTLEKTKFISNYGARTGIGCPEGLFGVSSWSLAGNEIRLMSPGGSLLARLRSAGNHWTGKTEAGLEITMVRD